MTEQLIDIELDQPAHQEAIQGLRALAEDLREKAIRSALHSGGGVVVRAMQAGAPDDPYTAGNRLALSINKTQAKTGTRVRTGAVGRAVDLRSDEIGMVIGPNKKVGGRKVDYIGWMIEGGTKPHTIKPKRYGSLLNIEGRWHRGSVQHPGIRANPWMSRAFDSVANQYQDLFFTGLQRWLDRNGR